MLSCVLRPQTLAIKTCQSKELFFCKWDDLKPLFWMFVLDELVFLLFLSCNHSYPCPLFCVLLSFQKGPTLTISHPPSNLRPATPYACVDAIIEVSAANIVQQRSFIEVTQWKPQMNRCHMSCFLFCEMPCLDPLKKKNTSYIDLFGEISPFFGWGGVELFSLVFFLEGKNSRSKMQIIYSFQAIGIHWSCILLLHLKLWSLSSSLAAIFGLGFQTQLIRESQKKKNIMF